MTVTDVVKDPENLTMTITAEFGAPVERGVGDLGRPAPAGALVGAADLPGDGRSTTTSPRAARSPTS